MLCGLVDEEGRLFLLVFLPWVAWLMVFGGWRQQRQEGSFVGWNVPWKCLLLHESQFNFTCNSNSKLERSNYAFPSRPNPTQGANVHPYDRQSHNHNNCRAAGWRLWESVGLSWIISPIYNIGLGLVFSPFNAFDIGGCPWSQITAFPLLSSSVSFFFLVETDLFFAQCTSYPNRPCIWWRSVLHSL